MYEWWDSVETTGGWLDDEEVKDTLPLIHSAGCLYRDLPSHITIVQSIGENEEM